MPFAKKTVCDLLVKILHYLHSHYFCKMGRSVLSTAVHILVFFVYKPFSLSTQIWYIHFRSEIFHPLFSSFNDVEIKQRN